jgi:hypothetical protein
MDMGQDGYHETGTTLYDRGHRAGDPEQGYRTNVPLPRKWVIVTMYAETLSEE